MPDAPTENDSRILPSQFVFGLSAFDNLASMNVNLNVDSSASVSASLSGELGQASSFGGSISVDTGLSVNAEADGDFFSLIQKGDSVTLFSKTWTLWSKSFGSQSRQHARAIPHPLKRDGLSCSGLSAPSSRQTLTDESIPSSQ